MNEVENVVNFLHADRHQSFLHVKTIIFGGHGQACSYSQSNCNILRSAMSEKGLYAQVQLDFTCCI